MRWTLWIALFVPFTLSARPVLAPDEATLGSLRESSRIRFTETFDLPMVADPSAWRSHFIQRGEVTSRRESPGVLHRNEPYCEVRLASAKALRLPLGKNLIFKTAPQIWFEGWTAPQSATMPILNDGEVEAVVCRRSSGPALRVGDLRTVFGNKVIVEIMARRGDLYPAPLSKPLTDVNRLDERLQMTISPRLASPLRNAPLAVFHKGNTQCFAAVRSTAVVPNWHVRGEDDRIQIEKSANGFETLVYNVVLDRTPITLTCAKTERSVLTVGDIKTALGDLADFQVLYQED